MLRARVITSTLDPDLLLWVNAQAKQDSVTRRRILEAALRHAMQAGLPRDIQQPITLP